MRDAQCIDYTHVRKLKQYPAKWIDDAIESYTEWMLFAKPWINFRGLHFDRSDFDGMDEKQGLIKFLDTVHRGSPIYAQTGRALQQKHKNRS